MSFCNKLFKIRILPLTRSLLNIFYLRGGNEIHVARPAALPTHKLQAQCGPRAQRRVPGVPREGLLPGVSGQAAGVSPASTDDELGTALQGDPESPLPCRGMHPRGARPWTRGTTGAVSGASRYLSRGSRCAATLRPSEMPLCDGTAGGSWRGAGVARRRGPAPRRPPGARCSAPARLSGHAGRL